MNILHKKVETRSRLEVFCRIARLRLYPTCRDFVPLSKKESEEG